MAVDHSVIRFAEKREGDVGWQAPYYTLRVGMLRVRFSVVRETGTMNVLYLLRAR